MLTVYGCIGILKTFGKTTQNTYVIRMLVLSTGSYTRITKSIGESSYWLNVRFRIPNSMLVTRW